MLIVKLSSIKKFLLLLIVFMSIVVPYINILGGVFHISILGFILIILFNYQDKSKGFYLLLLFIFVSILYPLIVALIGVNSGIEINLFASTYSFLPLIAFSIVFYFFQKLDFEPYFLLKFFLILSLTLVLIVFFQQYPSSYSIYSKIGYMNNERSEILSNYFMVIAPYGNSNITAFISATMILTLLYLLRATKNHDLLRYTVMTIIIGLFTIVVFSYARTVLGAILFSGGLLLLYIYPGFFKKVIYFAVLSMLSIYALSFSERFNQYYSTIFNPRDDNSFTARFDFWQAVIQAMNDHPYSWILGFGRIKDVLARYQSHTAIDSSYLFALAQYGSIYIALIVSASIYLSYKSRELFIFCIFLSICFVTIAVISDLRVMIMVAATMSLFYKFSIESYIRT